MRQHPCHCCCCCQVFDPDSTQAKLYNGAIKPIVEEVLEGFNCTIFAYGQTGTGKTYTMEARPAASAPWCMHCADGNGRTQRRRWCSAQPQAALPAAAGKRGVVQCTASSSIGRCSRTSDHLGPYAGGSAEQRRGGGAVRGGGRHPARHPPDILDPGRQRRGVHRCLDVAPAGLYLSKQGGGACFQGGHLCSQPSLVGGARSCARCTRQWAQMHAPFHYSRSCAFRGPTRAAGHGQPHRAGEAAECRAAHAPPRRNC